MPPDPRQPARPRRDAAAAAPAPGLLAGSWAGRLPATPCPAPGAGRLARARGRSLGRADSPRPQADSRRPQAAEQGDLLPTARRGSWKDCGSWPDSPLGRAPPPDALRRLRLHVPRRLRLHLRRHLRGQKRPLPRATLLSQHRQKNCGLFHDFTCSICYESVLSCQAKSQNGAELFLGTRFSSLHGSLAGFLYRVARRLANHFHFIDIGHELPVQLPADRLPGERVAIHHRVDVGRRRLATIRTKPG